MYVHASYFFHFVFGIGMEPWWQTTSNSKGNKYQTQQVDRVSLTLTPIQRLMQKNKAGLLPLQTAYVCQRGRSNSSAVSVWYLWPWNRLINDLFHGFALVSILPYLMWWVHYNCNAKMKLIAGVLWYQWMLCDNGSPGAEYTENTLQKF